MHRRCLTSAQAQQRVAICDDYGSTSKEAVVSWTGVEMVLKANVAIGAFGAANLSFPETVMAQCFFLLVVAV